MQTSLILPQAVIISGELDAMKLFGDMKFECLQEQDGEREHSKKTLQLFPLGYEIFDFGAF
jgi:hypothetical protein